MARGFTRASAQYLKVASTPITGYPLTMACWYRITTTASPDQGLMGVFNDTVANHHHILQYDNVLKNLMARTAASPSAGQSNINTVSTNIWNHAAGVFAASNSRLVYLNGVSGGANSSNLNPTGLNSIAVGGVINNAPGRYQDGATMECGIWNVALTAAEIAVLAAGMSPLAVRPGNLRGYWPLWGVNDPEPDLIGGRNLSLTNAPPKFDHHRIRYLAEN